MSVTVTEKETIPITLLGDLMLARLLPATKKPPTPGDLRRDVARFFHHPPNDDRWQDAFDGLIDADLLAKRPLRLTDAGRSRALAFLGVRELPRRCYWKNIRNKFLLPKALGLRPDAVDVRQRLQRADDLAALLLKRRYHLGGGPIPTLKQVLEMLVCHELGYTEATSLAELKQLVLSRRIESDEPLAQDKLNTEVPRVLLKVKGNGVAGFADSILDGWADAAPADAGPAEFDLSAFAQTVKAAARDCPTGRFGDNKVFISHVWRWLRDEPSFPAMDLPMFKERLTEANRARLLTLSRADLPHIMDATDVRESESHYLNAAFHFILVEKEQP